MPKYEKKESFGKKKSTIRAKIREPSTSSSEVFLDLCQGNIEADLLHSQINDLQNKIDVINEKRETIKIKTKTVVEPEAEPEFIVDGQLFGRYFQDEEMVHLKNETYCRKKIFDMAMGCSYKASHIARRLLEGVCKREAILRSTLTGQPPKSQGRDRQLERYECLNSRTKNDIVDFAIECGEKKGWSSQNFFEINRALSQKIGEVNVSTKELITCI